ncbi:MAG: hypothetical protein NC210_03820 [[Clostridium] fimetarium]|nr:hypothetical protein [Alistipes timonensis]MCM1405532.1 hypothetical protein [[Clostridium] fimetarium]
MARKQPQQPKAESKPLADACDSAQALKEFFSAGLGAMKKIERKSIKVPDTALIGGSVALDEAAKESFPQSNRWDYAIEYDGHTFFIEIHPAATSEIDCVIQKAIFANKWLKDNAPELLKLPKKENGARSFYWVSSGNTDIRVTPGSPQAKKLALHHIKPVGRIWDYAKLFK